MSDRRRRWQRPNADEPRDPYAHEGDETRADRVAEALSRAKLHGRAAAAETLAMLQALTEAASLAAGGRPSEASRLFGPVSKLLEGFAEELSRDTAGRSSRFFGEIAAAIDAEIAHWEARAVDDPEARSVLRAFLGLREVLWEIGVKPDAAREPARESQGEHRADPPRKGRSARTPPKGSSETGTRRSGPRVERVPVQG